MNATTFIKLTRLDDAEEFYVAPGMICWVMDVAEGGGLRERTIMRLADGRVELVYEKAADIMRATGATVVVSKASTKGN